MDSKLVVEQMAGRWKIKHPDMRPLAIEANRLAPSGTTYTWVPREQNKHADRLANEALDGSRGRRRPRAGADASTSRAPTRGRARPSAAGAGRGGRGGAGRRRCVLVRHGVTAHTADKRFSGGLASSNPGLTDEGRAQVRATADWLAPLAEGVDAVVDLAGTPHAGVRGDPRRAAGPRPVEVEPGFAEMEFGAWDGLTFAEVRERHPDELDAWLGSLDIAPGRRRVVPRGRGAGRWPASTRLLDDARRPDRRRGQPRHADQDAGRARRSARRSSRSSGWSCRPRR